MNKKTLISSLVMTAAVGISANASAAAVPGTLNDTWFETQVKQTLPKAINKVKRGSQFSSTWVMIKNKKIDSGKKTCYTHLINADNTTGYGVEVYCKKANAWTHQSSSGGLWNMGDGNVGNSLFEFALPASDSVLQNPVDGTDNPTAHEIFYFGSFILQPKKNKSGAITSVNTTPKQGAVGYQERVTNDDSSAIEGADKSNLKFSWVKNPDKIDAANDLRACAASWESTPPLNNVPGCSHPAP